ncbi:polyprenyl synthetase [Streptomyces caniscabiei]|uniref:Polyprenyl synthetase n=1 Tax=Streptomyces caniscabiei TaxID=2746961 RepID=A0A927L049_9ACTN|nr:polyprenyl synthetase [Streptomyces caniscabiei]MBD9722496.1 polyprenyl synthetase [Streptomyces caniscabiei]MDX3515167.1 polyprenyl synthetase [Streptomyces caniscabiei]MDX3716551.1 polyprenyl synthetase [Streptomyces caniscabiei]MDX3732013.1 polyprenyl synthetase [Streptomyces caniscabiei]WEO22443.1 polyprenyl synthetase [Streptomyces caniscabiei]
MSSEHGSRGWDDQAVLLVAGVADLAVTTVSSALGTLQGLMRRSDGAEIVTDAQQDLMARGRIALDRCAAAPAAHLEVLAQHAKARRAVHGVDV